MSSVEVWLQNEDDGHDFVGDITFPTNAILAPGDYYHMHCWVSLKPVSPFVYEAEIDPRHDTSAAKIIGLKIARRRRIGSTPTEKIVLICKDLDDYDHIFDNHRFMPDDRPAW